MDKRRQGLGFRSTASRCLFKLVSRVHFLFDESSCDFVVSRVRWWLQPSLIFSSNLCSFHFKSPHYCEELEANTLITTAASHPNNNQLELSLETASPECPLMHLCFPPVLLLIARATDRSAFISSVGFCSSTGEHNRSNYISGILISLFTSALLFILEQGST